MSLLHLVIFKKMDNSVWLEDHEVHLHHFLWQDSKVEDIEYAIARVNIGNNPVGCIAQVRETASLPWFCYLKEEWRVLEEDTYVYDILTSYNSLGHLKGINANIENILDWRVSHETKDVLRLKWEENV